jgi:NitT/TauT family transport system permease protein
MGSVELQPSLSQTPRRPYVRRSARLEVFAAQLALLAAILCAWQFLPEIHALSSRSHFFDPFFISSPTDVATRLYDLATGSDGSFTMWQFIWPTLTASLLGSAIGMVLGGVAGLILSNWRFLSQVCHPFVVALNAVPRIALIPIVVVLVGPTYRSSLIMSVTVVFFVAFFAAYEGGRTVSPRLLENAKVLGGSRLQIMRYIRLPYVFAWTLASLPLGVTFSILTVVTTEILTGYPGMGHLIYTAQLLAQSSLTLAVVVVLSVLGLIIVGLAEIVKRRVLHWWGR